jgi:hypothetical protein
VQRPLPDRFGPAYLLTAEDALELQRLLIRRDSWIEFYQNMELDHNRTIEELHGYVRGLQTNARLPLTGYVLQSGGSHGLYSDLWAGPSLKATLSPIEPVTELTLRGIRSEGSPPAVIKILVNGEERVCGDAASGPFEITARLPSKLAEAFDLEIQTGTPAARTTEDLRELAFLMIELRARHPWKLR